MHHGLCKANRNLYGGFKHYTPYSACMSPENTHKLMGSYMEVLILDVLYFSR